MKSVFAFVIYMLFGGALMAAGVNHCYKKTNVMVDSSDIEWIEIVVWPSAISFSVFVNDEAYRNRRCVAK